MKKVPVEQNTPAWLKARAGVVTASEMSPLVVRGKKTGEPWVLGESKGVETYLSTKIAEWWMGRPIESNFRTWAMDRGVVLETEALPKFELETGLQLERVGLVTTDDGKVGCSPDSMIVGELAGLECKGPAAQKHVKYLWGNRVPTEYFAQVQCSILVTGASHWWFMSYCPGFPELILQVERDEEYLAVMETALKRFHERFEEWKAFLIKVNGGEEPIRAEITEDEAAGIVTNTLAGLDPMDLL